MIDEKDRKILDELIKHSKKTTHQLSKKTGLPITTVHNRIKKLEKIGVIKNYTVNLDYKKLGRSISAFVGITINYGLKEKIEQEVVAKKISQLPYVVETAIMTGGSDVLVKVLVKDIDELNELVTRKLRSIDGVDKTQTAIVLKNV